MTTERFSAASRVRALGAMTAVAAILLVPGLAGRHALAGSQAAPTQRFKADLLAVPLSFEPNRGQTAATVQFLSRGSGYALFLAPGEVVLNLERQPSSVDTLRMSLIGANAKANGVGLAPQPGVVSYFIGNDPKKWRSGIPTYGKVNYSGIYPGIDLVFYGNQRQLEYDFVVAPGADPSRIAWRIEGARASVDAQGNLVLRTPNGPASFKKPAVYQMDGDKKTSVEGSFALAGKQVRFRLGRYDRSKPLVIDPVLRYATYLAGTNADYIGRSTGPGVVQAGSSQGIAVDASGSVYATGYTHSVDFPTTKNSYQSAHPAKDGGFDYPSAYVTKFSPDGSSLVYSTYLGGNGTDYAYAIAVDSSGSAYVTGFTNSVDFPVTSGAYQTVCSPIPTNKPPPYAASCNSSNASAFVTKLNPTGTGLVYSTFLGGYGWAYGVGIAVDAAGRAYVSGQENEVCQTSYAFQGCFPTTTGAVIPGSLTYGGSPQYAFVAVFDPTGAQLLYSTLFGDLNGLKGSATVTSGITIPTGMAVDSNGYFYLIGETQAGKLPATPGVVQPSPAPLDTTGSYVTAYRGFIAKFTPVTSAAGVSLAYATYLGGKTGNTSDYVSGIAVDSSSNVYVVGYTNSTDFPATPGAYSTVCAPGGGTCAAAHVTKLDSAAQHILWSTYVGGAKADGSDNLFFTGPIQLDGKGNVYIMGQANPGFPLVNPVEPAVTGGPGDVVVVELDPTGANLLFSSQVGSGGRDPAGPGGLAVDSAGDIYVAGNIVGPDLITTPGAFQTTNPAPSCCYHGYVAKIAPSATQITGVTDSAGYQQAISPGSWVTIWGTNLSATTRTWLPSEIINGKLPTQLDGVSVTIDGKPAAVYFISPGQLNVQVPDDITTGSVLVAVTAPQGTVTAAATMQTVSPGLFMESTKYVVADHLDYSLVAPPGLFSGSSPAKPGEIIILWATGFGPTSPPTPSGQLVPPGGEEVANLSAISVTIGGNPATVQWAGVVEAGLWQLNVQVPQTTPSGDAAIVGQIGGKSTQSGAFIAIQTP